MPVERVTCKVCDRGSLHGCTIMRFGRSVWLVGTWAVPASMIVSVTGLFGDSGNTFTVATLLCLGGVMMASKRRVLKCTNCGAVIDSA